MDVVDPDQRSAGRRASRWMARLAVVLTCLAVFGASAGPAQPARGVDAERMRQVLNEHPLRTLEGGELSLGALRGEVVVVNFWASWCSPCRKELPRLDALHAAISGKGGRVVAISIDHEPRNVRRFVRTHRLSLPVYHDGPDGVARKLDLPHVPFTVVLDRTGAVAFTAGGADEKTIDRIVDVTRRLIATVPRESSPIAGESP